MTKKAEIHELQHYMQCNTCGEYFDMRDLSEVMKHEHENLSSIQRKDD